MRPLVGLLATGLWLRCSSTESLMTGSTARYAPCTLGQACNGMGPCWPMQVFGCLDWTMDIHWYAPVKKCSSLVFGSPLLMTTWSSSCRVVERLCTTPKLHPNCTGIFCTSSPVASGGGHRLESASVGFVLDRQILLDWDANVIKTCALNHTALVVKAPLQPTTDFVTQKKIIVEGSVSDFSLLHAVRMPFNLVETLSPPCVSWSKGGTGGGLDSTHGFALLESVEMIFATQPIAAMLECADEIKSHHHFHVFGALMNRIGYKLAWEQIGPYHYLAHHYRNRWLALWVRCDIPATAVTTLFKLMAPPIVRWTDDRYSFTLPREVQHQLRLSPDQFLTYGELQLLPVGKRAKVHPSVTALQVIRARIPSPEEPLATLCSSYTQQHNLDRAHLERRGIFASIVEKNGAFLFLDPVRFVALLGTVTDIAIPLELSCAFHQIGSAISVPHALLCLLIMLSSVTKQHFPIQECIRKCWLSRIHADVTVVLVQGDHVWIRNVVQFAHMLPKPQFHVTCPNASVTFLEESFLIEVGQHMNFRELGAMLFRLQSHLMMQLRVEHFTSQPAPTDLVLHFLSLEQGCDLYLGGYFLCSVHACDRTTTTGDVETLVTLPGLPGVPTFHQGSSLPFGPFDPDDLLFAQAIENLENLNCTTTYPGSTFVIWAGRNLWAFTPFDGTEEHFATRIKTAFDRLVPSDDAIVIPLHKNFRWRTDTCGFILRHGDQPGFSDSATVLFEKPLPDGTSEFQVSLAHHQKLRANYTMDCHFSSRALRRMEMFSSLPTSQPVLEGSMMFARSGMSYFLGPHLPIGANLPAIQKGGLHLMKYGTLHRSSIGAHPTSSS